VSTQTSWFPNSDVRHRGDVCDIGYGPGNIARYLRDSGQIDVFGLDLSPRMVDQARQLNPDIKFQVGNMMALDLQNESLAGIVAFSIVNIPEDLLPTVFGEMWRVLKLDGRLLLSFHIGNQVVRPEELPGHPVRWISFSFGQRSLRTRWKRQGS
jgi:ubiquinone/menaquinone biosynthesis C-methylase UbiE